MTDPQLSAQDLIFGRWRSQILHAAVKLGVFEALAGGPGTADEIAGQLNLDPAHSYRLLRALGALELVREDEEQTFTLTETGDFFRKDHPGTLRGVILLEEGPEHYALWKHLPEMIRDGRQNAFTREFGRMAFEHADHDPGYAEVFNEAMSSYSSNQTAWALDALDGYDFSSINHLCDIGGGQGHMLCSFLARYPHLQGSVLEMPSVVENEDTLWAGKLDVADRCTYIPGDMFATIPSADAYMMKMILHDWNDEECIRILGNIAESAPAGGRIFIVEHIIPDPDTPHFAKLFDIHMMCWGTGRERTGEEYAALLEKAGWKYVNTWYPNAGLMGAVEGIRR